MNHYMSEYKKKLLTAEQAVQLIPPRGDLALGMAVSEPPALLRALEDRLKAKEIEVLNVYYMHSEATARETILKKEYMEFVKPHPFSMHQAERELTKKALSNDEKYIYYMPGNFSKVSQLLTTLVEMDACVIMVSPMDNGGFFSCGTNSDYTIPVARSAKKLIVEVNPNMPRVGGNCAIHISDVAAVVEHESPLIEIFPRKVTQTDLDIVSHIVDLIPDRATLQMGVGALPDAVCASLTNHKDLGIHSELMGNGLAKLIQSGCVTNKYKKNNRYKSIYTLAFGDKSLYEFLNNNAGVECHPVDYVNNTGIISQNDNMISINSFLQIDLFGQVNAEYIKGRQFSAPGGQVDFVRGAQLSKGGKSILVAPSTAAKGTLSRVVVDLDGPVTDPRMDVQYVATEYGVVNLLGKSSTARVEAIISLAAPQFREELLVKAKEKGLLAKR